MSGRARPGSGENSPANPGSFRARLEFPDWGATRLYEGYFDTPLRNLSIGGGSVATSLAIINSYRSVPSLILVETNILSRPIDQQLVDAFGANPSEPYQWFKPARPVISWLYYWDTSHRLVFQKDPADEHIRRLQGHDVVSSQYTIKIGDETIGLAQPHAVERVSD